MDVLRCQCRRCFSSTVAVAYKRFSLTYKQTKKCSQTKHSKKKKNNQPNKNFFLLETEQKRSPAKLKFSRPQKNTKKIVRRCYCCTNNKTNKPVPPQKKWRTEKTTTNNKGQNACIYSLPPWRMSELVCVFRWGRSQRYPNVWASQQSECCSCCCCLLGPPRQELHPGICHKKNNNRVSVTRFVCSCR